LKKSNICNKVMTQSQ